MIISYRMVSDVEDCYSIFIQYVLLIYLLS